jgi:hypothetical protein
MATRKLSLPGKQHLRNRRFTMPITKKRLEEIKAFKNTDFSDCPEMTDEQLAQLKPSHYRNMANYKPIKKTVNIRLEPQPSP